MLSIASFNLSIFVNNVVLGMANPNLLSIWPAKNLSREFINPYEETVVGILAFSKIFMSF